jgi:hypothetical protein
MEVGMNHYYKTEEEIRTLVESFEACSFHPSEFRHYQHLTVALWYVSNLPFDEATTKVTQGIRRLADAYGKTGYHETITLFWLRVVACFVAEREQLTLPELANALIEHCVDKNLIGRHYSADLLASAKAKAEWVEPDLHPLPKANQRVQSTT